MARKGGLGKGLGSLIPEDFVSVPVQGDTSVSIEKIVPNPRQPRGVMADEPLEELAASIREHGILQPLIVSRDAESGIYTLIAGERRLRAAKLAGLDKVPVILRDVNEQERLELALIENVQRADLSPLETAEAYRQLEDEFNLSHEMISERVGKSRVSVTNTMRLLRLPVLVQTALKDGLITEGHARAILGLETSQGQLAALQTIMAQGLNVRQAEELVRKLAGQKTAPPIPRPVDPSIKELEERLEDKLGTRVTLKNGEKGGTLVIHYYSQEELNGLVSKILQEKI
jgi:ParB family transcriptional regulator, chromosome partitioning protein